MMEKFWRWVTNKIPDPDDPEKEVEERVLTLNGTIAEESWFDDDVTPALFRSELLSGNGNITVWINSPGGDCFAAAEIYNMLTDYPGKVTVRIDGLAASAASVIAMAGDSVLVSPVSMIMIHNPATIAAGDHNEMQKAIEMLDSVKNSIINAYQTKTGLSRKKLSSLMENETWMDANMAVELGFADGIVKREEVSNEAVVSGDTDGPKAMLFSRSGMAAAVNKKLVAFCNKEVKPEEHTPVVEVTTGRSVDECEGRLDLIKRFM